ncbi:MAG: WD40 repeat domain-containing protein [Bacteroidota bacterium]
MKQRSWIIALVVAGIGLFLIILNFKSSAELWDAVPENSAVVLRTNFKGLDSLPNLFVVQQMRKDHGLLDRFKLSRNQQLLTVLQTGTPEGFNVLFITNVPNDFQEEQLLNKLQVSQLQGVKVYRNGQFAFAKHKGLLLIAPHAMQVESAVQQLNSGQKISNPPSQNSTDKVFLFPKNINYFLTPLIETDLRHAIRALRTMDSVLSGQWQVSKQGFMWKGKMKGLIPQLSSTGFEASNALAVLPEHTTFCFRGKLDFEILRSRIQEAFLDYPTIDWFGREMILGATSNRTGNFLILELSEQGKAALKALEENNKMRVRQHLMFTTYSINQIHFFAYDDRYLYLFENEKNLQSWINKYSAGKVLQNEESIQQLQAKNADFRHEFMYLNTRNLEEDVKKNIRLDWQNSFRSDIEILGNNTHLLVTFKQKTDSVEVMIHALKQDKQFRTQTAEVLLPIELKTAAAIPPQFINFNNQEYYLVQDEAYRLSAFDQSGNLLWEEELEDQILSKIHLLANGNLLFNTAFRVHLYDLEGQIKSGYPFELQPKATLGLCLVDFTQSGRYHYLLACENGSIYGYDLEGNRLEGWNPKDSIGTNIMSIQHFQDTERDFIVLGVDSTIQVYNRLGDLRFPIYTDTMLLNAPIAFQTDSSFPRIVSIDNRNRIHIINLEGVSFKLRLQKPLSPNFKFLFSNVWGDERKDYICLNNNRLQIYTYDENNKFELRSEVKLEHPQDTIFEVPYQGKNWIGMVSKSANRVDLYDGMGMRHSAFPLAGDQVFRIEEDRLLTASEEQILLYLLE